LVKQTKTCHFLTHDTLYFNVEKIETTNIINSNLLDVTLQRVVYCVPGCGHIDTVHAFCTRMGVGALVHEQLAACA
jgi:hypothetical protein